MSIIIYNQSDYKHYCWEFSRNYLIRHRLFTTFKSGNAKSTTKTRVGAQAKHPPGETAAHFQGGGGEEKATRAGSPECALIPHQDIWHRQCKIPRFV